MKTRPTAVLFTNSGWNVWNFRLPFLETMKAQGYDPVILCPEDAYCSKLVAQGYAWRKIELYRHGSNPIFEALSFLRVLRAYRELKPALVHHFTIKCVVYGSLAALSVGTARVINSITGLGHVFLGRSLNAWALRQLILPLYRWLVSRPTVHLVFQNTTDQTVFQKLGISDPHRTHVVFGSGFDLERFHPSKNIPLTERRPGILFAGRLIAEKGIHEFLYAAEIIHALYPNWRILIAGDPDFQNSTALSHHDLEDYRSRGVAEFLGHVDGLETLIAQVDLVVLPSHREGLPRVLLEAAAMEKGLVATDTPGCQDVVLHEQTGLLTPPLQRAALLHAILRLIQEPLLREKLGRAARIRAVETFSNEAVQRQFALLYQPATNR